MIIGKGDNTLDVTIGADPEVFVTKDGKLVCAHNMIQGTKEAPFKVKDGAVQVDGMALEFNIDPAHDKEAFVNNINSVYSQLSAMVDGYELLPVATAEFGAELMSQAPEEAKELGCEPDFNAWEKGAVNPKPNGDADFRTGAGHIHIGWTQGMDINDAGHVEACMLLVRQLDAYLGIPSVLLDEDTKRHSLYGKAGAFRVKPYGVEYRVLSNFWLKSPELMEWVYSNTILAIEELLKGESFEHYQGNVCQRIINRSELGLAETYIRYSHIPMPSTEKKEEKTHMYPHKSVYYWEDGEAAGAEKRPINVILPDAEARLAQKPWELPPWVEVAHGRQRRDRNLGVIR